MGNIDSMIGDAKLFINENPDIRTATFSLTKEEYKKFKDIKLGDYKVVFEDFNLNDNIYTIRLAKGTFNWLTGRAY